MQHGSRIEKNDNTMKAYLGTVTIAFDFGAHYDPDDEATKWRCKLGSFTKMNHTIQN